MGRNVYFRNHIHPIFHTQPLQVGKLFLGIRAVLCGQAGKTFAFKTECSIRLVPVIVKELRKAVIVQMNLELIHLIERKYLHILLQIVQCKELAASINHKTTVRK